MPSDIPADTLGSTPPKPLEATCVVGMLPVMDVGAADKKLVPNPVLLLPRVGAVVVFEKENPLNDEVVVVVIVPKLLVVCGPNEKFEVNPVLAVGATLLCGLKPKSPPVEAWVDGVPNVGADDAGVLPNENPVLPVAVGAAAAGVVLVAVDVPNIDPPRFAVAAAFPNEKPLAAGAVVFPNEKPLLGVAAGVFPNENPPLGVAAGVLPNENPPLGAGAAAGVAVLPNENVPVEGAVAGFAAV